MRLRKNRTGRKFLSAALVLALLTSLFPSGTALGFISTRNYGWILGLWNPDTQKVEPANTSVIKWNSMDCYTVGPWDVRLNGSTVGTIIQFVDKQRIRDNGYPMVGEPQWDAWIALANGNRDYVRQALQSQSWKLYPPVGETRFANFVRLIELCGGKGGTYDVANHYMTIYTSVPPYVTLLADKTQVNVGDTVTFTLKAQTNTFWNQYIDLSFAGAGKTYINSQRYYAKHVETTYTVKMEQEGVFEFRLLARDSVWRSTAKSIYIAVGSNQPPPPPPEDDGGDYEPPPPPPNQPPDAYFTWPSEAYEGEQVTVTDRSSDPDGTIVSRKWTILPATAGVTQNLGSSGGTVTFNVYGEYTLRLTVTDDDGAQDSYSRSIFIKQPIPWANLDISGTLKENRKVIIDWSRSGSPAMYPLDPARDELVIEPVSGGTASDIKLGTRTDRVQEVLFKQPGTYRVKVRVYNAKYASAWAVQDIVIAPDDPPVANFTTSVYVLRDPADSVAGSAYATIKLTDRSYSPDSDIITQRVWKYRFDSNNDGSFLDETWTVLDDGNNTAPTLRTSHVGKYLFELEVKEGFGQPTIPEFIDDSDYRTATTINKPAYEKTTEVINIPPVTSFVARTQPKADVAVVVGETDPAKIANINNDVNSYVLPKLLAKDVDAKVTVSRAIVESSNIVSDPSLEQGSPYWFWGGYVYTDSFTSFQSVVKHSGNKSLLINPDGSTWSYGKVQEISGWVPGDKLKLSAYINVQSYTKGLVNVDLFGFDSYNRVVWDTTGITIGRTTNGFEYFETVPEAIPSNVTRLYVRLFADQYPVLTVYLDDIAVKKVSPKPIEQVLNELTWRDNAQKFLVYLSDDIAFKNIESYSNIVSLSSSFAGNYGISGGNTAAGGEVWDIYYYWAKMRAIDFGKSYKKSDIFSISVTGYTGGGSTIWEDIQVYVSPDNVNWSRVGSFKATAYKHQTLTVYGNNLPYDTIRYVKATQDRCLDRLYVDVALPDFQSVEATDFASNLSAKQVNYSVLGTELNKAEADFIISKDSSGGAFFYNTNITSALDSLGNYIASQVSLEPGELVKYVLLNESIAYEPHYSDYEDDPKYADNWYYVHDPDYVDNNSGYSFYHNKILSSPVSLFDKVGKYDITYKAQDNPVNGDLRFLDYMLWSNPVPTSIIVHRKPVADFTAQPGTLNITDLSYDPDFQYRRPDKGIVEWEWKWKPTPASTWTLGSPNGITAPGTYDVYLRVQDCYGVWSDPVIKTITVTDPNRPPVAAFTWTPAVIYEGDDVTLTNQSYDPDGDPITYQWTVFDPQGVTRTYTTKNVTLSNVLPGTWWVTLRVWDNHGSTGVVTKSFVVNRLGINGYVQHTPDWNKNRIAYNQYHTGTDNLPRGYNVFWAGERFVLTAATTDTGSSATKAVSVTATLLNNGITSTLTSTDRVNWTGDMWQPDFEQLPDGTYTFRFRVTYSNGVVKTDDAAIIISGSWQDYFRYHRSQ
ncbi:PKD domain protein [Thermincola ferriacetica]|uniref:PKD domain protein n=1 Tax=Thermincola ferriacetica TaxID=281456 RepID=A0A0L6W5F7_9FIRM|nr:PKD domain-containing protein [Thermincola ferriacetica]KNZ70329.1 PKD domain protein [Thermincola ferriacetica]